jgi:ribonuclease J
MVRDVERAGCLAGATALWSMWDGYLEQPSGVRLRGWLDAHGISLTVAHTSGHATVADLRRLVEALRPERVVPIHTRAPESFRELVSACVDVRGDGEWWAV